MDNLCETTYIQTNILADAIYDTFNDNDKAVLYKEPLLQNATFNFNRHAIENQIYNVK